jgi:glycogen phosphorylase
VKHASNPMVNRGNSKLTSQSLVPSLMELALDLRWSWNHSTDEIWGHLDPELWELTQNPWVVLQTVSKQKIQDLAADHDFGRKVQHMLRKKHEQENASAWFQTAHPETAFSRIAYFSMEFMLSEALPIYSGGLGNVAGDELKAASDLGVPLVGVGLLYQQGYFRQEIDRNGFQRAIFPFNDPGQLPISPVRDAEGEWLRIPLRLPEGTLWVRTWQAQVGRTNLYLLDTNDPANLPTHRGITGELYGGGPEVRLQQEMVLGMAGWRLLSALRLEPEVCHLNEGHAAFVVLERAFAYMQEHEQPFDVALTVTRAGNLFTTHTSVGAAFDCFAPELMELFFREYAEHDLRIKIEEMIALGRKNPLDPSEPFNMAYLALRGSCAANGVSQLHARVSRKMFQGLFPRWPEMEVPIAAVTNGVHVPTWDSAEADELWTNECGQERWRGTLEDVQRIEKVSDEQLWELRTKARESLIHYARNRLSRQRLQQGASREEVELAETIFDPRALMIGFARRFAGYKRPTLLLHDRDRLARILTNRERPVQLILAGKAHPQDLSSQLMIKEWNDFIARADVRSSVAFLSDYDLLLTSHLVQGVDLWLNTPRRPWEACGTSGMKVLVNGGLNFSELDGWWAEAYSADVGWAIGDELEHGDDPSWDGHEANTLYDRLEKEIIPTFYVRDARGIPTGWVAKMRASMLQLTPRFSSNRTVREYVEKFYLPAAERYRERAANQSKLGAEMASRLEWLAEEWKDIRFGAVTTHNDGTEYGFEAQIFLGGLDPDAVQVELYAEPQADGKIFRQKMERKQGANSDGFAMYFSKAPATRPVTDYTARVIPSECQASVPLEATQILWQR